MIHEPGKKFAELPSDTHAVIFTAYDVHVLNLPLCLEVGEPFYFRKPF